MDALAPSSGVTALVVLPTRSRMKILDWLDAPALPAVTRFPAMDSNTTHWPFAEIIGFMLSPSDALPAAPALTI